MRSGEEERLVRRRRRRPINCRTTHGRTDGRTDDGRCDAVERASTANAPQSADADAHNSTLFTAASTAAQRVDVHVFAEMYVHWNVMTRLAR